ncbi:phosphoribosyl-AMP cyclohydrolase [Gammaproteobacteria bacterium]|nr:phosphoribosyl-AMP cyclohydrolase [Gammaproteobacteria bacterium]
MNNNDVIKFLNSWKDGVIGIGNKFIEDANYIDEAKLFLDRHYAFDNTKVLFKPTFTKEVIFRNDKESALSYFINGDIAEDNGFAIKPWKSIDALDINFMLEEKVSVVMGVLNLKPYHKGLDTKIAFTFVLDIFNGDIKIKAHHSSPISN